MRYEGACRCAARDGLQDGGLDLEVALLVEELAHGGDYLGALDEGVAHLRVDHQIDITLAIAHFGVGQGVELLAVLLLDYGQGAYRLREDGEAAAVHRLLARVGDECEALDADEVAYVEQFLEDGVVERRVALGADVVAADVYLYAARVVLQFKERGAAHDAAAHDAAGDAHVGVVGGVVGREPVGDLCGRGRHVVHGGGVGLYAQFSERGQRAAAQLFLFAEFETHMFSRLCVVLPAKLRIYLGKCTRGGGSGRKKAAARPPCGDRAACGAAYVCMHGSAGGRLVQGRRAAAPHIAGGAVTPPRRRLRRRVCAAAGWPYPAPSARGLPPPAAGIRGCSCRSGRGRCAISRRRRSRSL